MKILHLFPCEKFTDGFVSFINKDFDSNMHNFWLYGKRKVHEKILVESIYAENSKHIRNLRLFLLKKENVKKMEDEYDRIFVHSLFSKDVIELLFINKGLRDKTFIYLWGGDFYPESLKDDDDIREKREFVIKNVYGVINITSAENADVKKLYKREKALYYTNYYDSKKVNILNTHNNKQKKDDVIRIQIGNSATQSNRHIECLDYLERYKNEKIEIYIPLSYGDTVYANEVERYGRSIFGDKCICIKEFMELEEYYRFMEEMDVAIFNLSRQQALANIIAQFAFGTKIFLRENTVLESFFYDVQNVKFSTVSEIGKMSFEEFYIQSEEEKRLNREKILKFVSEEEVAKKWSKLFEI